MRYIKIMQIAAFMFMALCVGPTWAQHPEPPPQPQTQPAPVQTPVVQPAPPPSQRMPVTPPGMDYNARPFLPPAIQDTLPRKEKKPGKVNLPPPGSFPALPPTPHRALSTEEHQAWEADMQTLRQWYKDEQVKLLQSQGFREVMVQNEARRKELVGQLQTIRRQWAAIKPVASRRPEQLRDLRARLNRLSSQVEGMESAQKQALARQYDALAQNYFTKQEDVINKYFRPDNLTGEPLEDFAMTHFQ